MTLKKILSVVLTLMLVFSVAAIGLSAADPKFKVSETGSVAGEVVEQSGWVPWTITAGGSSYDATKLPGSTNYYLKVVSKNYAKLYKGTDANGTFMTDIGINQTNATMTYAGLTFRWVDISKNPAEYATTVGVGSWLSFKTEASNAAIGYSTGAGGNATLWTELHGTLYLGGDVKFSPSDFTIDDASFSSDVFAKNGYYTVQIDYTGDKLTITGPQGQVRVLGTATTVKTVETDPNDASKTAVVTTFTVDGVKFSLTDKTIKNGDYFVVYYNAAGIAATTSSTTSSGSSTGTSTTTTPKTGDNNAALAFAGLALISAAAVVVSKKKVK